MDENPAIGDLIFVWGTSPIDYAIRFISGGPSHVRLYIGCGTVAEMIMGGFHYGRLDSVRGAFGHAHGARTELVETHLTMEQQRGCLHYVLDHQREKYSFLAVLSQFLNRCGSPLVLNLVGRQDCSQFAAAALGMDDWEVMWPARLYQRVKGG